MKLQFTKRWIANGGSEGPTTLGQKHEHRRGVWQRRFWEHTVRDEDDYQSRFDYVHFNPVKHELVKSPYEWQPSSFHRWVKKGVYPRRWACGSKEPPGIDQLEGLCGEAP